MPLPSPSIVFRGDDAGANPSATRALVDCAKAGLIRNVGLMIPPVTRKEDLEVLHEFPDTAVLGLHATITSEWDGQRWGPVLGADAVPSLVQADGTFHPNCAIVEEKANPDEVEREVRAQLQRMREWGFDPVYLDTHMVFVWIPALNERMAAVCAEEGLVYGNDKRFPKVPKAPEEAPADVRGGELGTGASFSTA